MTINRHIWSNTILFGDTAKEISMGTRHRWPREDEIRSVEWELLRARHGGPEEKSLSPLGGRPIDLEVWLAKEKERKSWKDLGDSFFERKGSTPESRRSEARRSYDRVELYLRNPQAPEFQDQALRRLIQQTFGVSADSFRTFILKGRLPRPQRKKN
jgi:hypothetical protein